MSRHEQTVVRAEQDVSDGRTVGQKVAWSYPRPAVRGGEGEERPRALEDDEGRARAGARGQVMRLGSLAELLGMPCAVHGVRIGEVTAVFLNSDLTRILGLDVRSPGSPHRFLPWVAAEFDGQGVDIRSAFLLVDAGDSYTRRGARAISDLAELASLRVDDEGRISSAVVVSTRTRAGMQGR